MTETNADDIDTPNGEPLRISVQLIPDGFDRNFAERFYVGFVDQYGNTSQMLKLNPDKTFELGKDE